MEDPTLLYLCYKLEGPFRPFMVPRDCLTSFAAVRNCVDALGFSAVRCSISRAVLFERLWPAGLTAINVIVQEPCPVSDGVGLFEGDHGVQQFKEQSGAYQLPSECVNLFDKMPTNIQNITTWAIAQTPLTSYEVLHLVLRREGCRLGNVYVEHRQCLSQVHPRAWPTGLKNVYAFVERGLKPEPELCVAIEVDQIQDAGSASRDEDNGQTPASTIGNPRITLPVSVLPVGASATQTQNDTRFYMGLSYDNWFHFDFQPFTGEFPTVGAALNTAIARRFAAEKPGDVESKDWLQEFANIHLRWKTHEMEIDCREDNKEREEKLLLWSRNCPSGSVVDMGISRQRL